MQEDGVPLAVRRSEVLLDIDLAAREAAASEPPVFEPVGLVKVSLREHEAELQTPEVLSIASSVSILIFALPPAWRAWKCGGP